MASNKNWMSQFMDPSKKGFMSWLGSQTGQYNPAIKELERQFRLGGPANDFMVGTYNKLLGAQPSREGISGAFQTAQANLANYMKNLDTSKGAQGVSDIIGSIGAGIGAAPGTSMDLAQAAGTLSGVGAQGGDVMSKAIMSGMSGQLAGQEVQALSDAAKQNMELMLGLGQAKESSRRNRNAVGLQLAQLLGQKKGATLNPLDVANAFMTFSKNKKSLADFLAGSSGRGSSSTRTGGGGDGQVNIDFSSPPIAAIASGLNGLVAPGSKPRAPYTNPTISGLFN